MSLSLRDFFYQYNFFHLMFLTCDAGRLNAGCRWSAFSCQQRRLDFLSDALFLIERLMLPVEAPRAYNFAVPSRIVLLQHVGDLWPLGSITQKKGPVGAGTRTRDSELVCLTASHQPLCNCKQWLYLDCLWLMYSH